MSVEEPPEYSITEFILGSLFFAIAVSLLIWAVHAYTVDRPFDAMRGAGLSLIMFAACANPLSYFGSFVWFPFRLFASAERGTNITMLAALIGSTLLTAGWLLAWLAA